MLDNLPFILQQECKLQPDDLLLVGVSGGPDSLCLLHVLHQYGYPLLAVHINHKLRPEADDESQAVNEYVNRLNIRILTIQADVTGYSQDQSVSLEEAARILRYHILFEQASINEAVAVAVGHNADDQVETILMHLLRGTGLVGLRGMEYRIVPNPWSDVIPLIRPFLSTWRVDIQKYIDEHGLIPIFDSSNLDNSFFRNRIRHDLLPTLESYNPAIRNVLLRMGQIMKDDYALLEQFAVKSFEATLIQKGEGFLAFDTVGFSALPISTQRFVLRKAIECHHPGLRDVNFDCIERGRKLIAENRISGQVNLVSGLSLIKEGDRFWVTTWNAEIPNNYFPQLPQGERLVLLAPSRHMLNDNWVLEVEPISDQELSLINSQENNDPYQTWMDITNVDQPLFARSRRPGDQIKPLGMNGQSIKISDLMINLKIPKRVRASWPLICSGDEILWVPGLRLSHTVRLNQSTHKGIHLSLFRY